MQNFKPVDRGLFFSKNDPTDQRLGDVVKSGNAEAVLKNSGERSFVVVGYPDDDGIKINGGRVGASEAPDRIRKYLYKMTPSFLSTEHPENIFDLGNLEIQSDLKKRHLTARLTAESLLTKGYRVLSLGGGHDYGFSDSAAFCSTTEGKPLVINFDAHLDVRPDNNGLSSGTPFFRLLNEFKEIDFLEIGIQGQCNSQEHVRWLEERGGKILSMEEIRASGETFAVRVLRFLEPYLLKRRPCFLSVDIDAFTSSEAPGCSQSWATGFRTDEFFDVFQILLKRLDVRSLAVYEVSPPLDQDDRTSKLAALIAHRFLFPL